MKEINPAIAEALKRASEGGIETGSIEIDDGEGPSTIHYIALPSGAEQRRIYFHGEGRASNILQFQFEKYAYLKNYEAVVNLEECSIEALVSNREPMSIERGLGFGKSPGIESENEDDQSDGVFLCAKRDDGIELEISAHSNVIAALIARAGPTASLSLKIRLGRPVSLENAITALEVFSNSLFFQIELDRGVSLYLRKAIRRPRPLTSRKRGKKEALVLNFPAFEYDSAPLSLYWYGKSARGMPLLQYLAFYQVAEYYFPNFMRLEAVRNATKILKNPTFRVDRESDMTRLVATISTLSKGGSSEREQLKATILEVLTLEEINAYFKDNSDAAQILSKKQKGITDKSVHLAKIDHDHRPEISDMLYDIRCKIVHTKNDSESFSSEILLPFSAAEEGLWACVDLMQFVAKHCLIRSSIPIRSV